MTRLSRSISGRCDTQSTFFHVSWIATIDLKTMLNLPFGLSCTNQDRNSWHHWWWGDWNLFATLRLYTYDEEDFLSFSLGASPRPSSCFFPETHTPHSNRNKVKMGRNVLIKVIIIIQTYTTKLIKYNRARTKIQHILHGLLNVTTRPENIPLG